MAKKWKNLYREYKNGSGEYHIHVYHVDGTKGYIYDIAAPENDFKYEDCNRQYEDPKKAMRDGVRALFDAIKLVKI